MNSWIFFFCAPSLVDAYCLHPPSRDACAIFLISFLLFNDKCSVVAERIPYWVDINGKIPIFIQINVQLFGAEQLVAVS